MSSLTNRAVETSAPIVLHFPIDPMSNTLNCCSPCSTVQPAQIPGLEGVPGLDGTDGINAFTHTSADFVVPNAGDTVSVTVDSSAWMVIGQGVIVGIGVDGVGNGPAHFRVSSLPSSTSVVLEFANQAGDLIAGDSVGAGSTVSPAAIV